METTTTQARAPTFFTKVVTAAPGDIHLEMCIQCDTYASACFEEVTHDYRYD